MSSSLVVKLFSAEQARLRLQLRSHLRGRCWAWHILLLLSPGGSPAVVAQVSFHSLRTVHRSRAHWRAQTGPRAPSSSEATCLLAYAQQPRLRS